MSEIVDAWFALGEQMLGTLPTGHASSLRPASLRDACYAYAISSRLATMSLLQIEGQEAVEAYVNGLELGALMALRSAWNARLDR